MVFNLSAIQNPNFYIAEIYESPDLNQINANIRTFPFGKLIGILSIKDSLWANKEGYIFDVKEFETWVSPANILESEYFRPENSILLSSDDALQLWHLLLNPGINYNPIKAILSHYLH